VPALSPKDAAKMLLLEKRAEAAETRLKENEKSRSLPPRKFSDGEEIFNLRYTCTQNFSPPRRKNAEDMPREQAGNESRDLADEREILITWDELFQDTGACVFREASEKRIREAVIESIKSRLKVKDGTGDIAQKQISPEADEEYSAEIRKALGDSRLYASSDPYLAEKVMGGKYLRYVVGLNKGNKIKAPEAIITISDAVLYDIIFQFHFLELIEVSTYKHSLSDDSTYWTLTKKKGRERLKNLRVKPSIRLRKSSSSPRFRKTAPLSRTLIKNSKKP
jgi:hypothetical protein